ncbi:MAG TPA: sigma-70 family RNA polymerase sigma factor [Acidobacteriota bacterium]|nr:sigma-70 family RNA polymerase sigma factor [Acidobacteriota bacterium]
MAGNVHPLKGGGKPMLSQHQVTSLLLAWSRGEDSALDKLIPLVYSELHRLAHRYMVGERQNHTLQTTAVVNEAYLRLVDCQRVNWRDRAHFLALSAELVRRVLIDYARSRHCRKRGGAAIKVSLDEGCLSTRQSVADWLALDRALHLLAELDPRKGRVVELRFFGGLSIKETAEVLQVSQDTIMRDWRLAKAWLLKELKGEGWQ